MAITIGASTSASGATGTKPTCSVGDVLVACVAAGSGAATITISGFTNVIQQAGVAQSIAILVRDVTGSEGSSFTASEGNAIGLFVVPGATASPLDATPTSVSSVTSSATIPSQTTATNGDLILTAWAGGQGVGTDISTPSGMTEVFDLNGASQTRLALDYQAQATAGATGTKAATVSGLSRLCGAMIVLKEKPPSTNVNIPGEVAAIGIAGIDGSISAQKNVNVAGQVAAIGITAIDGVASAVKNVSISGQVAAIGIAGIDGSISVTRNISIAGEIAAISIGAPDGVASAVKNISIAGEVAAIGITALDGVASAVKNVSIAGEIAAIGITAIDGSISAVKNVSIAGEVAAISIGAPDGIISADVLDIPGGLLRESLPEPLLLDRRSLAEEILLARAEVLGRLIVNRITVDAPILLARAIVEEPLRLIRIDGDEVAS